MSLLRILTVLLLLGSGSVLWRLSQADADADADSTGATGGAAADERPAPLERSWWRSHGRRVPVRPAVFSSTPLILPSPQAAPAAGAFHFERRIIEPVLVGVRPEQVLVADVTGDHRLDIVMTMNLSEEVLVRIYEQDGQGGLLMTFETSLTIISGEGGSLALADLDGDGAKEIVVGTRASITVYRRSGDGFIETHYVGKARHINLAAFDYDGDGYEDVFAQGVDVRLNSDVYLSDGAGGIREVIPVHTPLRSYNTLEVADVTEDGYPDLVLATNAGSDVWAYSYVPGQGGEGPYPVLSHDLVFMSGFTIADMDADGIPDVVVSEQAHTGFPRGVHVFYRGPGNTVREMVRLPLTGYYQRPGAVKVADLDGNGLQDIVVMINSNDEMVYFLQHPAGFAAPVSLTTDDNPWTNNHNFHNSFAIADMDSDGCPDVVLAEASSSLRVFYGRNCTVRPVGTGGNLPPERGGG